MKNLNAVFFNGFRQLSLPHIGTLKYFCSKTTLNAVRIIDLRQRYQNR